MSREDGLRELIRRHFTSHGPATAKDLRWWSSLTIAEINRGIEMAGGTRPSRDRPIFVEAALRTRFDDEQLGALQAAADGYGAFLGRAATVTTTSI